MYPEIHNAMPVDINNRYFVSNVGARRAPHFETSTITFVQLRSNERHVSFHAEKNSMLNHDSLQPIFDNPFHMHVLNRRHSQSRRQWLRAKGNKVPTTDNPKCSIARSHLYRSTLDDLFYSSKIKSNLPTTFFANRGERVSSKSSSCLDNYSLTSSLTLANNSHFFGTKSLLSTSQLLPSQSKVTSTKRGLHQLYHIDPQFFIAGLPGSSNKTRPTGHRRGRLPRLVTETLLPAWPNRPKSHRRGRPPNTYPL